MSPSKFIPLESTNGHADEPLAFTDVVIAYFLANVPDAVDEEGTPIFESAPLADGVIATFSLGCAVGVEFPQRVTDILVQTHGDEVEGIVTECRESLTERIHEAVEASEPLEAESFVGAIVDTLEERPYADGDTAQNALSMSFEYGCILGQVQRGAAISVRNEFNRSTEEALEELEEQTPDAPLEDMVPFQTLQELARELMLAYEADVGFEEE